MIPDSKIVIDRTSEDLLQQYLSLSEDQREQEFPSTTLAAQLVGVSIRTIQLWIEGGKIKAICIGKNYKVHLGSLLAHIQSHVDGQ